jgi:insulysin
MTFNTSNSIQKPDLDDREYKIITLQNGLTALLISDPKTDKSAAALDVNVGAFSDYEHLPGLAHFCEHLLFMGTKKYPSENEYSSYLSNHGGHSNAYTAAEDTNYYFEINHQYLEGALDRFSQFFIEPLFDPSGKDREIRAVDSENKKNLQNDTWRLYQLSKSLSNPEHPYHKFSTGNLTTLGTDPESKGIDVRDELLRFYKDSYSSNLMKLAVIGREDLSTLEQWVLEKFTSVPNYNRPKPTFEGSVYTPKELKKLIKARPVMSKNKLSLSFVVPDHEKHWEVQTSHYYSHLIGHEGDGSLFATLKSLGLVDGLSAGGYTISEGNAEFGIDIDLTEAGLENFEDILVYVFQYIKLLKESGPQEYVFEELKEVGEVNFKFKQKSSPSATVSKLAKDLQKTFVPPEYILSKHVLRKYDPKLIAEYSDHLNADNLRITLISQKVETDLKEKWYGTDYSIADISDSLFQRISNVETNTKFHLPIKNDFIPTNFDVEKLDNVTPSKKPVLIRDDSKLRFWFKKDDQFWVPKGYIQLSFNLPATGSTPVNFVLTSLYAELVKDSLTDTSYQAELARLKFDFLISKEGLILSVSGYNQKSPVLLKAVLEKIVSFKASEERFNVIKEKSLRSYRNHFYNPPYNLVTGIFSSIINDKSWSTEEKLSVVEKIEFKDLESFIPLIFKQAFIEGLITGNFYKNETHEIIKIVEDTIKFEPLTVSQHSRPRSFLLPKAKTFKLDKVLPDEENINSCIQYFIQVGEVTNDKAYAKTDLIGQLVKEPAFDVLRTKEQLGYIVFSGVLETRTTFGFRIIIQSERNSSYLESRIVNFLGSYLETLKGLSEEEFEQNKEALINKKLQALKNLGEENNRYFRHLASGYYDFLQHEKDAALIKEITKEELIQFYQDFIINTENSKFIVNLHAKGNTDESKVDGYPTGTAVEDYSVFKGQLYLTPAPQPVEDLTFSTFGSKL